MRLEISGVIDLRQDGDLVGANPAFATLEPTLWRIARSGSGCRQFRAAAAGGMSSCPLWSSGNAGGAGVVQLASPAPIDDEVWSWRANVAGVSPSSTRGPVRRTSSQGVGDPSFVDHILAQQPC